MLPSNQILFGPKRITRFKSIFVLAYITMGLILFLIVAPSWLIKHGRDHVFILILSVVMAIALFYIFLLSVKVSMPYIYKDKVVFRFLLTGRAKLEIPLHLVSEICLVPSKFRDDKGQFIRLAYQGKEYFINSNQFKDFEQVKSFFVTQWHLKE